MPRAREKVIHVRVSESELARLEVGRAKANRSMADFVRTTALAAVAALKYGKPSEPRRKAAAE
jgi:hypothetical protein